MLSFLSRFGEKTSMQEVIAVRKTRGSSTRDLKIQLCIDKVSPHDHDVVQFSTNLAVISQ